MGSNRGQIKSTIRVNLDDAGVTFYSDSDLNESLQDAYDDIVCMTQCITTIQDNISWPANLVYINPKTDLGLSDYLATVAIFNNNTKRWLRDDLTLRDFDRIRRDWEMWQGTPQFWSPSDPNYIAIAPTYQGNPTGTLKMVYWAQAPVLVNDSNTFLTASDVQNMFEFYCTADMLEQAEEFQAAGEFWEKYYGTLAEYSHRVKLNNKADLLMRV